MIVDDLDKRLLQHLSSGISSYEELARNCNVTRNTVYRRIAVLERNGIIKKTVRSIIDYNQLEIASLCIAVTVAESKQEEALALLRNHKYVKFLWRTFGHHNIVAIVFCSKGKEGEILHDLTKSLEEFGASAIVVAVGFKWDKMDFAPFSEDLDKEEEITLMTMPEIEH